MTLCLGIDTGGTYTDAVIVDDEEKSVLAAAKSLTTYPDPIEGIRASLDSLPESLLEKVKIVSVSTTLSTNTVLEKTGDPAALILIGDSSVFEIGDALKTLEHCIFVSGGHNGDGSESAPLDTSAIENFVLSVKDKVSAFAVSSYFSIRNPEHELKAKEIITKITSAGGMSCPVVCGGELAQSLGAYERGITAYLNAVLLPVTHRFVTSVVAEINRRHLSADIKILKCNGSVSGIEDSLKKPIESIFSGPAASLLGASFLSGHETCLMIDVGGTSTDISLMEDGFPDISDEGAVVGGWKTKVRAIRMETSALGGDSQIWIHTPAVSESCARDKIQFGPRRIIPLCRAASFYPEILPALQSRWFSERYSLNEYVQPVRFFIRSGTEVFDLTPDEKNIYDRITDQPVSLNDILWDRKYLPTGILQSLVSKKAVHMIGFTPTDVLHVLGDYKEYDTRASLEGARILASALEIDAVKLCTYLKHAFASKMAQKIVYFLGEKGLIDNAENITVDSKADVFNASALFETKTDPDLMSSAVFKESVKAFLSFKKPMIQYKVNIPIVMIGGPVGAYVKELSQIMDAVFLTPQYFEVGNAVGALVGKIAKRVDISVRSVQSDSKYDVKSAGFIVYFPGGRHAFTKRDEALEYARGLGKKLIFDYMSSESIPSEKVYFKTSEEDIGISKGTLPIVTKMVFEGYAKNVF